MNFLLGIGFTCAFENAVSASGGARWSWAVMCVATIVTAVTNCVHDMRGMR